MKKKFYNVGMSHFAQEQKQFWWIAPAAIAAAQIGASIFSSSKQASAQRDANELNYDLGLQQIQAQKDLLKSSQFFNRNEAEKSRDFNMHEASRQMDFQKEMAQKLLDYNTPEKQVSRYLQAGLNPATLNGSIDSSIFGVPSGVAASSSPASVGTPSVPGFPLMQPVNPYSGIGDAIKSGISAYSSFEGAEKIRHETKGIITDNDFKRVEKELNLDLTRSEIKKNAAAVRLADADANLANEKIAEVQQNILNLKAQESNVKKEGELLDIEKLFKSKAYNEQLRDLMAKADLSEKQADAYMKVVYSEIAKNMGAADAAYASAAASRAMASLAPYEREKLQAEKDFIRTQDSHSKIKRYLDWKYGGRERRQALRVGEQNLKVAEQQEKQLKWQNNGFVRGVGIFKDVAVGSASVVGTVYGAGAIGRAASSVGAAKVVGPTIYTGSQPLLFK